MAVDPIMRFAQTTLNEVEFMEPEDAEQSDEPVRNQETPELDAPVQGNLIPEGDGLFQVSLGTPEAYFVVKDGERWKVVQADSVEAVKTAETIAEGSTIDDAVNEAKIKIFGENLP